MRDLWPVFLVLALITVGICWFAMRHAECSEACASRGMVWNRTQSGPNGECTCVVGEYVRPDR